LVRIGLGVADTGANGSYWIFQFMPTALPISIKVPPTMLDHPDDPALEEESSSRFNIVLTT
jgi:hypothetical protein